MDAILKALEEREGLDQINSKFEKRLKSDSDSSSSDADDFRSDLNNNNNNTNNNNPNTNPPQINSDSTSSNNLHSNLKVQFNSISFKIRPPQWISLHDQFIMTLDCSKSNSLKGLIIALLDRSGSQRLTGSFLDDCSRAPSSPSPSGSSSPRPFIGPFIKKKIDSSGFVEFNLCFKKKPRDLVTFGIYGWFEDDDSGGQSDFQDNGFDLFNPLLKSCPIRVEIPGAVQVHSQKTPSVRSLSPPIVPSSGPFPNRQDRMLLIFGQHFFLHKDGPRIILSFPQGKEIDIPRSELVWWNENLIECQLPTLDQDIEVRVLRGGRSMNSRSVRGKVLRVITESAASPLPESAFCHLLLDCQHLSNESISLEYTPADAIELINPEVKVFVSIPDYGEHILAETRRGRSSIQIKDISVLLKVWVKHTNQVIQETRLTSASCSRNRDHLSFSTILDRGKITGLSYFRGLGDIIQQICLQVFILRESDGEILLDPLSRSTITTEKPLLNNWEESPIRNPAKETSEKHSDSPNDSASQENNDASDKESQNDCFPFLKQTETSDLYRESKAKTLTSAKSSVSEIVKAGDQPSIVKAGVLHMIYSCKSLGDLSLWESALNEVMEGLHSHSQSISELLFPGHPDDPPKRSNPSIILSSSKRQKTDVTGSWIGGHETSRGWRSLEIQQEDQNQAERVHVSLQQQAHQKQKRRSPLPPAPQIPSEKKPASDASPILSPPSEVFEDHSNGTQQAVYWKFYNPGTRNLIDLEGGRLQIIGSRRIQMLVESEPPFGEFISANIYIMEGDSFELIKKCLRCQENGIPNVFCMLPRRGREYDYPWITFRITCTSTAKHWKGRPFWIGAKFRSNSAEANVKINKVFSPAIFVQSKMTTKDLERHEAEQQARTQNGEDKGMSSQENKDPEKHFPQRKRMKRKNRGNFQSTLQFPKKKKGRKRGPDSGAVMGKPASRETEFQDLYAIKFGVCSNRVSKKESNQSENDHQAPNFSPYFPPTPGSPQEVQKNETDPLNDEELESRVPHYFEKARKTESFFSGFKGPFKTFDTFSENDGKVRFPFNTNEE